MLRISRTAQFWTLFLGMSAPATLGSCGASDSSGGVPGAPGSPLGATTPVTTPAAASGLPPAGSDIPAPPATSDPGGVAATDQVPIATATQPVSGDLPAATAEPSEPVVPTEPGPNPTDAVPTEVPGAAVPSSGCGNVPLQAAEQWVEAPLLVGDLERRWWTYLPNNYDPNRAYPVVMLLHGCGTETNNLPMQSETGEDAILVRGVAQAECWELDATGPDIDFFDAMMATVAQDLCVDTSRLFAVGYSSGSWLINRLDCVRGDVLRAAASVAGGTPGGGGNQCVGSVARMFVHDLDDTENLISGSITERERLIDLNGCDRSIEPVAVEPAPCVQYQGCDPANPLIWCETSGLEHSRQDDQAGAFWDFLSSF